MTWWPLSEALGASGLLERVDGEDPVIAPRRRCSIPRASRSRPTRRSGRCAPRSRRSPAAARWCSSIDDLQWAEPTFLDLLEHLADWVRDAPLLLLAMARPELLDLRAGWGGVRRTRDGAARAARRGRRGRAAARAGRRRPARPAHAPSGSSTSAEGNPLYVVEVVAHARRRRRARRPVERRRSPSRRRSRRCSTPRLDRLRAPERAVIEARRGRGQGVRARERVGAGRRRGGRHAPARARAQGPRPPGSAPARTASATS